MRDGERGSRDDGLQYSAEPVVEGVECVEGHELGVGAVYAVEGDVTIHGGDEGVGARWTDEVVAL